MSDGIVCLDLGTFQPNMRKKKVENIVADFMAPFIESRDLDLYPQSPNSEHRTLGLILSPQGLLFRLSGQLIYPIPTTDIVYVA
jgi:hypothetical protein